MASMNGAIADFRRQWLPEGGFVAKHLGQVIGLWLARRRERMALTEMDERLLRDIGIDRLTAQFEADRPFWDGGERRQGRWW